MNFFCLDTSFVPFLEHDYMKEVRQKVVFLHLCLPGQDNNDELLPEHYEFPTLDGIAHDILTVLDAFEYVQIFYNSTEMNPRLKSYLNR